MPFLVSDVKASVIRQFGDDTGAQIVDADLIRWVNEGVLEIFRSTEENEQQTTIPTVVGTAEYTLPTTFYKLLAVRWDNTLLAIRSSRVVNLLNQTAPVGNATPTMCYVRNAATSSTLVLFRTPDRVANLVIDYQARPALITVIGDTVPISDAFRTTLETYCLAKAKQMDGDMGAYQALLTEATGRNTQDAGVARDPYDDFYPFITTIPYD